MPRYQSANGARASGGSVGGGVARPSAAAGGSPPKAKKLCGAPGRRNAADVPASEGQGAPPVSGSESPCAAAGGEVDRVSSGSGSERRSVASGSGSACALLAEAGESEHELDERGTGDSAPSTADEFTAVSPTENSAEDDEGSVTQGDGSPEDDSEGEDPSSRDYGNGEAAGGIGEPSDVPAAPDPRFLLSTAVAPLRTESAELEAVAEFGAAPSASARREEGKAKAKRRNPVVKPVTAEKLEAFKQAQDRTGVVFLSRLPPFMKPQKVRHMLEKFGEIGRLYLAAEDPKTRLLRKKSGGNKKKNYTEGWVEFKDKRVAKTVALSLNNTIMGGSKRSFYHDDLWNIKYLPKFKWNHLAERIAYEKAAREQRLRAEIAQARRETKLYAQNVEKANMLKNMEKKKRRRAEEQAGGAGAAAEDLPAKKVPRIGSAGEDAAAAGEVQVRRRFKQRETKSSESALVAKPARDAAGPTTSDAPAVTKEVKSLLSKLFGK